MIDHLSSLIIFWGVWLLVPILVDGLTTMYTLIGVSLVHLRSAVSQHGNSVRRVVAQVDLDAAIMPVGRHIPLLARQPGKVPRVVVSVDQRHNGNSQAGHQETGLRRCVSILRYMDAAAVGDFFHYRPEALGDLSSEDEGLSR